MKNKYISLALALLTIAMVTASSPLEAKRFSIKTIPENGQNVDWPVLYDNQYFSFRGRNASTVTLRSIIEYDCGTIIELYDENPQTILDCIMLVALVNVALRGVDVQSMEMPDREDEARTYVLAKLRQLGRIEETKAMLENPDIIPSVGGLCDVWNMLKHEILSQRNHVEHRWDYNRYLANK